MIRRAAQLTKGMRRWPRLPLPTNTENRFDFDELAKDLAHGLPRREVLRRVGGLVIAGLLTPLGAGKTAWAKQHPGPGGGQDLCTQDCLQQAQDQLDKDVMNCDSAIEGGNPRSIGVCLAAAYAGYAANRKVCETRGCPFTQTCVNGACCPDSFVCQGLAAGSGTTCCDLSMNQSCCDGACVTLGTNQNCSDCNDTCSGGKLCFEHLQFSGVVYACLCPPGESPNAIGQCVCVSNAACSGAIPCCDTNTGMCVALGTDQNCHACGDDCTLTGQTCVGGQCTSSGGSGPCLQGQIPCGSNSVCCSDLVQCILASDGSGVCSCPENMIACNGNDAGNAACCAIGSACCFITQYGRQRAVCC